MGAANRYLGFALALLAAVSTVGKAEEQYTFDVSEFEKSPFDFRGYVELLPEYSQSNQRGALYQLTFFDEEQQDSIDRLTGTLELEGRHNRGIATLMYRTHSDIIWDYEGETQNNSLYEGLISLQPVASFTAQAGKKATRWGKGVAWNPVAFVERAKDAGNPDLAREGFWMTGVDWIRSFDGPLQTLAITPLIVPTYEGINEDFGERGHTNPAGKVYLLYRNTDIDFLFLGQGSRSARYGVDFARNLAPNLEIHGEFAYITDVQRIKMEPVPSCRGQREDPEDVVTYLLGLRYRTEQDITYTLEYYYNGLGNSPKDQRRFYECVHTAWETDNAGIFQRLPRGQDLDRGPFTRPNPMRQYLHLRAYWDEPFNILYFAPGMQAFYNLSDHSFSLAPELNYTGINNLELRLRAVVPFGPTLTEWGEKPNDFKVDLRVRYYF